MLDSPCLPYACHQCGAMLHRDCIDLPRVIRISRHQHRLVFAPSLPLAEPGRRCQVCRKAVDHNYGAYSCSKGCDYTVHPKCATSRYLWDGKDVEGEPEEAEDQKPSFEVVDDKTIRHFSHKQHNLELKEDEDGAGFDGSEHCETCGRPARIHVGNLYTCEEHDCDFVLHEKCAKLPQEIWFLLHPHRLTLKTSETESTMCYVCRRHYSGIMYECRECREFKIDVECASVSEPLQHVSHPHPLFSMLVSGHHDGRECSSCHMWNEYKLECVEERDFVLCFTCLNLAPEKVRYKPDTHPLELRGHEDAKGIYWCEICEEKLDPKKTFYTCDICCVTVHMECVLGKDPYAKPGRYDFMNEHYEIAANNTCHRSLCEYCQRLCLYPTVFKNKSGRHFCCLSCYKLWYYGGRVGRKRAKYVDSD